MDKKITLRFDQLFSTKESLAAQDLLIYRQQKEDIARIKFCFNIDILNINAAILRLEIGLREECFSSASEKNVSHITEEIICKGRYNVCLEIDFIKTPIIRDVYRFMIGAALHNEHQENNINSYGTVNIDSIYALVTFARRGILGIIPVEKMVEYELSKYTIIKDKTKTLKTITFYHH